jgi:hypothetical protein
MKTRYEIEAADVATAIYDGIESIADNIGGVSITVQGRYQHNERIEISLTNGESFRLTVRKLGKARKAKP